MKAETTRRPLLPAWASALRMKWTRQRCQLALSTLAKVALMPSWASETTSLTPRKPRRASDHLRGDLEPQERHLASAGLYLVQDLGLAHGVQRFAALKRAGGQADLRRGLPVRVRRLVSDPPRIRWGPVSSMACSVLPIRIGFEGFDTVPRPAEVRPYFRTAMAAILADEQRLQVR